MIWVHSGLKIVLNRELNLAVVLLSVVNHESGLVWKSCWNEFYWISITVSQYDQGEPWIFVRESPYTSVDHQLDKPSHFYYVVLFHEEVFEASPKSQLIASKDDRAISWNEYNRMVNLI